MAGQRARKDVPQQRAKVVVVYDDETVEEFNPNRPRYLLDMEKEWGVQSPETHEQVFWLAHHVLAKDVDFDKWVDTVADVDTVDLAAQRGDAAGEGRSSKG